MFFLGFSIGHFDVSLLKVVVERRMKLVGEDWACQRLRLGHWVSQLRANNWFRRVRLRRGRGKSCCACVNYRSFIWHTVWSFLLSGNLTTWKEKTAVSLRLFINWKQISLFVSCWVHSKLTDLRRLAVAVMVRIGARGLVNTSFVGFLELDLLDARIGGKQRSLRD